MINKIGIHQQHITPLIRDRGWQRVRQTKTGKHVLLNTRHVNPALTSDREPKISYLGKSLFESWDPFKGHTNLHKSLKSALESLESSWKLNEIK